MTTIAASKTQIACDLQATGAYKFKLKTKIRKFSAHPKTLKEDYYAGYSGELGESLRMFEWLQAPDEMSRPRNTKCNFLFLTVSGRLYMADSPDPQQWYEVDGPYAAIGSGSPFAMAAMLAGKTPTEAVKIACKMDSNSGMGVKFINL